MMKVSTTSVMARPIYWAKPKNNKTLVVHEELSFIYRQCGIVLKAKQFWDLDCHYFILKGNVCCQSPQYTDNDSLYCGYFIHRCVCISPTSLLTTPIDLQSSNFKYQWEEQFFFILWNRILYFVVKDSNLIYKPKVTFLCRDQKFWIAEL